MTYKLHDLLREVGLVVPHGMPDPVIEHITTDSRLVGRGSLFLGLPGGRVDGGIFWRDAIKAGAVASVIGKASASTTLPGPKDAVVVVPDPVASWVGQLAAAFFGRPSEKLSLIGVTGTNGKTTTTHLIEHLSSALGCSTALFGTLVNRWPGVTSNSVHTTDFADGLQSNLSLAVNAGAKIGVMEVSSHALDQKRVAGCLFSGAVFTNLTQDHLDYHNSMQEYFDAKAQLFMSSYLLEGEGRAVINVDDQWGLNLANYLNEKCWRCSLAKEAVENGYADLTLSEMKISVSGVGARIHTPRGDGEFFSPLFGQYNLMNLLQAVGALLQQGLPLDELLKAIPIFGGVPGRMERVLLPDMDPVEFPTVLVDYAHTPDALKNALKAVMPFVSGKLVCVFGCGGDRDRTKRSLMGEIAAKLADKLVLTSDNPRTEDPVKILNDVLKGVPAGKPIKVEVNRSIAIANAIEEAESNDLILIAGKGHEDYQILGEEKVYFDDRQEAKSALRRIYR